jgi:hypothetical protein
VDELSILGLLELVAVWGLSAVFREAYNTSMLQQRYHSIDIHFILFHVKFEVGLSILVWKNRATCHKNRQLEIVKFL